MTDRDDAELLRRFQQVTAGSELSELRDLVGGIGAPQSPAPERPELRRPPLTEPSVLRIRAELDTSDPPIWRVLDIRSDATLDRVHQVLQTAFGWADAHLHRFALGGHPFDQQSQLFLCPFDLQEGEPEDVGGIAATDVRVDETLQNPGDVLAYVYDYGDSWELTLRLEEVRQAPADAPIAALVDGDRAAPPEDSGGATDAGSLAEVLEDPAFFNRAEVEAGLRAPSFVLAEQGAHPRLIELMNRLRLTPAGPDSATPAAGQLGGPRSLPEAEFREALRPWLWFLERAQDGGIELTASGYLKPADVEAASLVVPAMRDWIGKNNRESLAVPLLDFRTSMQKSGMLRKYKGRLLPTRAGAAAGRDPAALWEMLAAALVPRDAGFEQDASLLVLSCAAAGEGQPLDSALDWAAAALGHLGWQQQDGSRIRRYALRHLPASEALMNVSKPGGRRQTILGTAAATLARAALTAPGFPGR